MQASDGRLCLIDGFPRNLENLHTWEEAHPKHCQFVLNYTAPAEVLQQRLLKRADGSRSDDNPGTIARRFQVFFSHSVNRQFGTVAEWKQAPRSSRQPHAWHSWRPHCRRLRTPRSPYSSILQPQAKCTQWTQLLECKTCTRPQDSTSPSYWTAGRTGDPIRGADTGTSTCQTHPAPGYPRHSYQCNRRSQQT